jgi:hypothetical protein
MAHEGIRLIFQRGDASAEEIQVVVDEVLAGLSDAGSADARAASAAGLDPNAVAGAEVRVREGEQGAEPFLTTVAVAIAVKAGSTVADDLWTKLIWPRVRRRLGATAVGEPAAAKPPDSSL